MIERDQAIENEYLEGSSLKKLAKKFGGLTHERVRQILLSRGISLRKPGPITKKTPTSFGKLTTKEKFLKMVTVVPDPVLGDHWILPHKVEEGRYGKFIIKGKIVYAHRAAFYLVKGRFPTGRLRKQCRVLNCAHPNHWKESSSA